MSSKEKILARAIDITQYLSNFRAGKEQLTLIQLRTLLYIKENGPIRSSDLAKEYGVTPATITAQLDRLSKTGWIKREHSKNDRRATEITLTKKADRSLKTIVKNNLQELDWVFDPLSEKEQECLLGIVEKIHTYKKNIEG